MANIARSGLTYPNRGARALLLGLQDLLGGHGLVAVLKLASLDEWVGGLPPDTLERAADFAQLTALTQGLVKLYGQRSGSGLARQANRVTFAETWSDFGALSGFKDEQFLQLPLERRLKVGGMAVARVFNEISDLGASFIVADGETRFEFENCPYCLHVQADAPICGALTGWIEGALGLIGADGHLLVSEMACTAVGDARCTFHLAPSRVE
jgi:hypothetical protein